MAETDDGSKTEHPEQEALGSGTVEGEKKPWIRGLWMVILAALFALAELILLACAVLQFGWYIFGKGPNRNIADVGVKVGAWLNATARYQTGVTEDRPWPWNEAR